jgi:predicted DNA-binding protein
MPLGDDLAESAQPFDGGEESLQPEASSKLQAHLGNQSRLISRVLAPALRLWVRSQLDHVEDLHIAIEAGDRQMLSGEISRVSASAQKAVYQGLHFSQIQVAGQQIQTNLRQVLRGKPFRLLQAFPVSGTVSLTESDLNASMRAPLLSGAIADFLLSLLQQDSQNESRTSPNNAVLRDVQVQLEPNGLTFLAVLVTPESEQAIALRTGLAVKNGNLLKLEGFHQRNSIDELVPLTECRTKLTIPLGSDVYLETLEIQADVLICQGRILVRPGE